MEFLVFVTIFMFTQRSFCSEALKSFKYGANSTLDPDTYRNVSELILSKGYPVENHVVETKDGYLLSVQRIPFGKLSKKTNRKKPVLLIHGFLSSSADWVINYPHQSLGFILADYGYDVWLGNTRGNSYSRSHIFLHPNTNDFWNFSLDEMAKYDLPAMIDYILNKTMEKSLTYIGYSQGSTVAFALLSERPFYNKKINLFVALAPEAEVSHSKNIVSVYVTPYVGYLETRLPVYMKHYPNGGSAKNLLHFFQMVAAKKFQKYDYRKKNKEHYNQNVPPEYNVSKITTPIALFWGKNDNMLDVEDISILKKKLKSVVFDYSIPWEHFNHIDFVIAKNARDFVYNHILSLLRDKHVNSKTFSSNRQLC